MTGTEATAWQENPLFVCGHRKSGTTLLISLFDHNPQLCVFPDDSSFWYAFFPLYDSDDYSKEDKVDRIINTMFASLRTTWDRLDATSGKEFPLQQLADRFRTRMQDVEGSPRNLLREAVFAVGDTFRDGEEAGFLGWCEKTTSAEVYAAHIFDWFPNAKVIHLLRDPRDNFASLKSGWQARYRKYNDTIERLLQSMIDRGLLGMKMAQVNAARYGSTRYRVVRFEDLTAHPEPVMRELADFAGIDFNERLLFPTAYGMPWKGNNFDGLKFKKPDPTNVGRWRSRITDHEAALIEFHFEKEMLQWDYEPVLKAAARADAATQHYKWHNFTQTYSVAGAGNTFKKKAPGA